MNSFLAFALILAATDGSVALDKARVCYESLDYVCADQQLAIALRSNQDPAAMLAARKLDLQLAFAWRDERRMKIAAQRIFEFDPSYSLSNFPPDVRERLERHRPEPPKSDALFAAIDYRLHYLSPSSLDHAQWQPGEGGRLKFGKIKQERLVFAGQLEWIRHYWRGEYGYTEQTFYELSTTLERQLSLAAFRILVGGGVGVNWRIVGVDSGYEPFAPDTSQSPLGFSISSVLGACAPIKFELYGCLGLEPKLLIRAEKGQPKTSYIFPLGLGLRYEYGLGSVSE